MRRLKTFGPWLVILGSAAGCVAIADLAPVVDEEMVLTAKREGIERELLEQGRHLYISDCATCHSPVAVDRFGSEKWSTVLPRMVKLTRLDANEQRALEAYIATAGNRKRSP